MTNERKTHQQSYGRFPDEASYLEYLESVGAKLARGTNLETSYGDDVSFSDKPKTFAQRLAAFIDKVRCDDLPLSDDTNFEQRLAEFMDEEDQANHLEYLNTRYVDKVSFSDKSKTFEQRFAALVDEYSSPEPPDDTKTLGQHVTEIVAEVRCDERARIAAILNHAEAAGRRELAEHIALTTDMPVDEVVTVLSAAAKSQSPELSLVAASTNAVGDAIMKGQ